MNDAPPKIHMPGNPNDKPTGVEIPDVDFNNMTPQQAAAIQKYDGLGDEMKTFTSPIDGMLSIVSMKDGHEVCQYCFLGFGNEPQNLESEIYPLSDLGNPDGVVRVKVHGQCHEEKRKEVAENLRPA